MNSKWVVTAALLSVLSSQAQAGDIVAGREKSTVCIACHGVDGNSNSPVWPHLAGQHAEYIYKQLRDFHSGARENEQMSVFAVSLSERDMRDLAAYYSSQKGVQGSADETFLELGEKIFRAGIRDKGLPACMACHGPNGSGNPAAAFPALGGQHAKYTEIQLHAFRDNERTNDANKMMRIIAQKMTTDEIEAVANYIQGLR